MGFSTALAQLSSYISHQSANLDDQISRLEKARQKIRNEQNNAFNEWNKQLIPDLGTYWEGNRAMSFNDSRIRAYQEMRRVFHDEYDDYLYQIETKITMLEQDQSVLSIARNLIYDAELLLKKGDEAADKLQGKINQIRRHLYS